MSVRLIVSEDLPDVLGRFRSIAIPDNSEHKISEQLENNVEADNSENINSVIGKIPRRFVALRR
jgi:hypothetical protein